MKRKILFAFALSIMCLSLCFAQSWSWAKNPGTGSDKSVNDIYTEQNGTSYITGSFSGTVLFDTIEKTATDYDFFLAKLDSAGNYYWVYTWNAEGNADGTALTLDPMGNIYVTGTYNRAQGKAGIFGTMLGDGDKDIFIAKFLNSGTLGWAAFAIGTGDDYPVALDFRANNLAVTGNYSGALSIWDGFLGEEPLDLQNTLGTNTFVIAFDAPSGSINWTRSMGNPIGARFCNTDAITYDSDNNICIAGTFSDTAKILNVTINSINGRIFLLKLSSEGNLTWVTQIKSDGVDHVVGLSVDSLNNIIAMGNFNNNIHFGPIHTQGIGDNDIFWAKYSSGGSPLLAKAIGGPFTERLTRIVHPSGGTIFGIGSYGNGNNHTILGQDTLEPYFSDFNTFLFSIKTDGDIQWTSGFGGISAYETTSLGLDGIGNIYLSGYLSGSLTFGNFVVESFWGNDEENDGKFDAFIARFGKRLPAKYVFNGNGLWSASDNWQNSALPGTTVYQFDSVIIASNPADSCFLDVEVTFEPGSFFHINENSRFIVENDLNIISDPQEDSTFTDPRDGNVYTIKRYGNQVWMTMDLRYAPGNPPPPCGDCIIYGRFYPFPDPAIPYNFAPPGWHIPTEQEWQTLVDYLGGNAVAGAALKDTLYWNAPNTGATNSSGFNARGGGLLNTSEEIEAPGDMGFWWTSTVGDTQFGTVTHGRYFGLTTNSAAGYFDKFEVELGFKIRCVKD